MKQNRTIILSFITASICVISSIISMQYSIYWFITIMGGGVVVLGLLLRYPSVADGGLFLSIFFFIYAIRYLPFSVVTLMIVLGVFYLFVTLWVVIQREFSMMNVKRKDEEKNEILLEFEMKSTINIFKKITLALVVAFTGSFLSLFSPLEVIGYKEWTGFLALIFGTLILIVLYIIVIVLPKMYKE
ncbi:MAG: hypothetical protein ACOC85_00615 [Thermoplasmatota archaeon]